LTVKIYRLRILISILTFWQGTIFETLRIIPVFVREAVKLPLSAPVIITGTSRKQTSGEGIGKMLRIFHLLAGNNEK
jgi:hypothetical protein